MPISQDRFMTILSFTRRLLNASDELLTEFAPQAEEFVLLNSVLENSPDERAKDAIRSVQFKMALLRSILRESRLTPSEEAALLIEEKHFAQKQDKNLKAKIRMKEKRNPPGSVGSHPQGPAVPKATSPAALPAAPTAPSALPSIPQFHFDYIDGKITKEQYDNILNSPGGT